MTALLAALIAFDGLATLYALRAGYATEGNPLVAALISRLGPVGGLALRTLVAAILVVALGVLAKAGVPRARVGIVALTVVYVGVASWHVFGFLTRGT